MAIIVCVQGTCLTENSYEHNIIPYHFFSQVVAQQAEGVHHLLPLYSGPGGFYGVLKGEGSHGYEANKARIQRDIATAMLTYDQQDRVVLYGHSRGGLIFAELAGWMAERYPGVRVDILTSDLASGPGGYPGPLAVSDNVVSWINVRPQGSMFISSQAIQKWMDVNDDGQVAKVSGSIPLANASHNTFIFVHSKEDCHRVMSILLAFWHGFFTPGRPLPEAETNIFTEGHAKLNYFGYGTLLFKKDQSLRLAEQALEHLQTSMAIGGVRSPYTVGNQALSLLRKMAPQVLLHRAVANVWPQAVQEVIDPESLAYYVQGQLDRVFEAISVWRKETVAKAQLKGRVREMVLHQDMRLYQAQKDQIKQSPQYFQSQGLRELVWALFIGVHGVCGKIVLSRGVSECGLWGPFLTVQLPRLSVEAIPAQQIPAENRGHETNLQAGSAHGWVALSSVEPKVL